MLSFFNEVDPLIFRCAHVYFPTHGHQHQHGFEIWTELVGRTAVTRDQSSVQFFRSIKSENFNLQRTIWTAIKPLGLQDQRRFYRLDNEYFEEKSAVVYLIFIHRKPEL